MRSSWIAALGLVVGCTTPNPTFDEDPADTGTQGTSSGTTVHTSSTSAGTGSSTGGTRGTDGDTTGSTTSGKTTSTETTDEGSSGETGSDTRASGTSESGTEEGTASSETRGSSDETRGTSDESSGTETGCELQDWYPDRDDDEYGGELVRSCEPPPGNLAMVGGDCDDDDERANPGLPEVCGDGVDNDCNQATDELEECAACSELPELNLFLCDDSMTWEDAEARCGRFGGHLVVIPDEGREEEIVGALNESGTETVWLGLTREDGDATFTWVGGILADYTNWVSGELVGNCAYLSTTEGGWSRARAKGRIPPCASPPWPPRGPDDPAAFDHSAVRSTKWSGVMRSRERRLRPISPSASAVRASGVMRSRERRLSAV